MFQFNSQVSFQFDSQVKTIPDVFYYISDMKRAAEEETWVMKKTSCDFSKESWQMLIDVYVEDMKDLPSMPRKKRLVWNVALF